MTTAADGDRCADPASGLGREDFIDLAAVADARRRPMSERLELALSWNEVAAELRAGLAMAGAVRKRP